MMSSKIVATMLVMYIATMLAAQTEGFVPIFTYSDVQRMQEKERDKGQKKSLSVQQRSEEGDPVVSVNFKNEEENKMIKLTAPVEIGIRMNSRQLEKYQGVLEELLTEVLLSTQNG
ncbi:promotilin [Sarcophilus harrisii]|uniref:Promotilin n=1 Tax=Sarcophilus harrisii TaxID=9305 RepID=A0A7N4PBQ6_SARHA|nr:promotilin [Sarcophilus harrisii]XP_031820911.1 promotilin [Sarcophilus harrisii]XP_031820912.1 promotilin [Sarcophilus harrisii]XP_031820913.1 promotilin [Sarcophilus harrisii]